MGKRVRFVVGAGLATAALCGGAGTLSVAAAQDESSSGPISGQGEYLGLSAPARDLPPAGGAGSSDYVPSRTSPLAGAGSIEDFGNTAADPLADAASAPGRTPGRDLRFNGIRNPFACSGCSPPDTIGDVSPTRYVQMVNATKVGIYDKTGDRKGRAFDLGDLFPSGNCTNNFGDPVVLWDDIANRWLLSQFATPSHLCFAISQTPNPRGAYHLYTFNVGAFPDYFKVGVWPNGYYVSANEASYTAYAFNRTKMLAGDPTAEFVKFTGQDNFLLPADVDGRRTPTGGGLFYTFKDNAFHGGADRIELFRLVPNFANPPSSTFVNFEDLPVTPYTYTVCGFFIFNCIPQGSTTQKVDAVSEWPMHRFAYRRFGNREALVGNFTIDVGSDRAGIRWFELRDTGSGWELFQEGTHAPGSLHRFMGSIAMDRRGNIALGYSVSSSSMFPAIRYATRERTDPLGTLEPERTMRNGGGSQTGSNRWGDYSSMNVDPATDCQFWYTNQYYRPSSPSNWRTAVAAFTMPGCS